MTPQVPMISSFQSHCFSTGMLMLSILFSKLLKPRDKELEAKLAYLSSLTLLQNHGDQNNVAEAVCSMFLVQNSPEILTDNCESSPSKVTHDASFTEGPRALVTYSEPSSFSTPTALLVHTIFVLDNLTTSQEIVAFLNRTNAQKITHGPVYTNDYLIHCKTIWAAHKWH